MARRVVCVWFPRLASDLALRREAECGPFALSLRVGNADHLHCLNAGAAAAGLVRGMALADARALCPGLRTRAADTGAEARGLAALIRWAGRYSPLVARDGAEGLALDIAGVAHLFGGEAALVDDLRGRLARAGIAACAGLADTRGAAWALARHGGGIAAPGQALAAIGGLPPAALRIDHETAGALSRLGLRTIRDLAGRPRAPLARQFGAGLLLRLDQALGEQPEPISPAPEPPHFGVRLTLPEPVGLTADVMAGLGRLLDRLCGRLAAQVMGARRLRLELRRVDGAVAVVEIGLARPQRDATRIAALFAHGVEEVDAGFGIDGLRLSAPVAEPLAPRQTGLGRGTGCETGADRLADLLSRLGNRLGFENLHRLRPADSHIPERSFLTVSVAWADPASGWPAPAWPAPAWFGKPERPVLVFPPEPVTGRGPAPPARFRWRRVAFTTLRVTGPERIAPEWWMDDPGWRSGLRDYWKVETREGRRLWLFHTPQAPGWHVQGEFA